jgi:hypothetical protein
VVGAEVARHIKVCWAASVSVTCATSLGVSANSRHVGGRPALRPRVRRLEIPGPALRPESSAFDSLPVSLSLIPPDQPGAARTPEEACR